MGTNSSLEGHTVPVSCMVSTNASGTMAVRYGATGDYVLGP